MLDIGWSELLLIGIVALIVIGPEDLPKMFRTLGRITARARSMAREFSSAMEDAAKSSGLEDAANTLKDVNKLTSKKALGLDALDRAADRFEKWDPLNPRPTGASALKTDLAAPTPAAPVDTPVAPTTASSPPAPQTQPKPQAATPPAGEQPSARRLHAVRRADKGENDRKGV